MCEPWEDLEKKQFLKHFKKHVGIDTETAISWINDFLNQEQIFFGDSNYEWCETAAKELAEEFTQG